MPSFAMPVDARRRHAAALAAAIGTKVAVAGVVGHNEQDVGLLRRLCRRVSIESATPQEMCSIAALVSP